MRNTVQYSDFGIQDPSFLHVWGRGGTKFRQENPVACPWNFTLIYYFVIVFKRERIGHNFKSSCTSN